MAYVTKRESDRARGRAGKWTCWFVGADGKKRSKTGTTDKAESQKIANHLEAEALAVRQGRVDPAEEARRLSGLRPAADHVREYREDLEHRGDTAKHARDTANALVRLLADAACPTVADLAPDRVRAALGRMKARGLSARRCNFHLAALKAFASWLAEANRIEEPPRGLMKMGAFNEKEDRRLIRRALTVAELARLLEAAEKGDPVEAGRGPRKLTLAQKGPARMITGPERAALYRLAMGTGFRANELRTLTPECFRLDGDTPEIALEARNEKNRKGTVQPITRELAAAFRPFLEGKPPGRPVLHVPSRTAKMLRGDLAAAGIDYRDGEGRVVDFHALRGSYITHLINAGVNPKVVQTLARHSTIMLTLDRYTSVVNADLRKAMEGGE